MTEIEIYTWEELGDSQDFEHGTKFVEFLKIEKFFEKYKTVVEGIKDARSECRSSDNPDVLNILDATIDGKLKIFDKVEFSDLFLAK